jgi:hypothetical protein
MNFPIYSLQIIDYWCHTALQTQKELIRAAEVFQSFHCLSVSLLSAYALCQHWIYHDSCILLHMPTIILGQLLLDTCFVKRFDMLVHHIATIGIIGFYKYYLPPLPPIYLSVLVSTEISTIFLVLEKHCAHSFITQNLFVLSFFYTRIYLFSKYLVFHSTVHQMIFPLYSIGYSIVFYACLMGLFYTNVYWAIAILKKLYTSEKHEYWMRYAYFVSPCISCYVYYPYVNWNWNQFGWIETCIWLDILGQVLLAFCSFQLKRHSKYRDKYFVLNEIAAKHVRFFLFVLAKYISIQQNGSYSPNIIVFYGLYFLHVGFLSYIIHHIVQTKTLTMHDACFRMNQDIFLLDIGYVAIYTENVGIAMLNMGMICLQLGLQADPDILYICNTLPLAWSLAERFV